MLPDYSRSTTVLATSTRCHRTDTRRAGNRGVRTSPLGFLRLLGLSCAGLRPAGLAGDVEGGPVRVAAAVVMVRRRRRGWGYGWAVEPDPQRAGGYAAVVDDGEHVPAGRC